MGNRSPEDRQKRFKSHGLFAKEISAPQRTLIPYAWIRKLSEILNPFAELQRLSSHLKTEVAGRNFLDDLENILNHNSDYQKFSPQAMTILRDGINTLLQTDENTDLNHLKQKIAERYGSESDPAKAFQKDLIQHIDDLHTYLLTFKNSDEQIAEWKNAVRNVLGILEDEEFSFSASSLLEKIRSNHITTMQFKQSVTRQLGSDPVTDQQENLLMQPIWTSCLLSQGRQ